MLRLLGGYLSRTFEPIKISWSWLMSATFNCNLGQLWCPPACMYVSNIYTSPTILQRSYQSNFVQSALVARLAGIVFMLALDSTRAVSSIVVVQAALESSSQYRYLSFHVDCTNGTIQVKITDIQTYDWLRISCLSQQFAY